MSNIKIPAYRQALNLAWYRAGRQIANGAQGSKPQKFFDIEVLELIWH
jgi:hypothetical protein